MSGLGSQMDARERLERLHLALEAAVEQLTYAQQIATRNSDMTSPPTEVLTIERLLGDATGLRNRIREQFMRLLAKPTLNIIK